MRHERLIRPLALLGLLLSTGILVGAITDAPLLTVIGCCGVLALYVVERRLWGRGADDL